MKQRRCPERTLKLWNSSDNLAQAARKLKVPKKHASAMASELRRNGYPAKLMPNIQSNVDRSAPYIPTVEEIWETAFKLRNLRPEFVGNQSKSQELFFKLGDDNGATS